MHFAEEEEMKLARLALVASVAILSLAVTPSHANPSLACDFGLTFSPGYRSMMDDVYSDYEQTGGLGFLGVTAGLAFDLAPQTYLSLGAGWDLNFVVIEGMGDESYMNNVIFPFVALTYAFQEGASPYLKAELNYDVPKTGSDRVEWKSGGIGFGLFGGFEFSHGWAVQAGYRSLPVDVGPKGFVDVISTSYNMGGFVLAFGKEW
jgi:hypothetical protein